jgi:hypothetical protein
MWTMPAACPRGRIDSAGAGASSRREPEAGGRRDDLCRTRILYVVLLITLGIFTIRKGHWIMFIVGIFFPLFWLIGAVLPPTRAAYERA